MIPYTLIRSARKTVGIYITKDAATEVRAPLHVPKDVIDKIVAEKEGWIAKHTAERAALAHARASFALTYGGMALCRGTEYPICPREGGRMGFDESCFFFPPGLTSDQIRQALEKLYRLIAKNDIPERVWRYASQMGVKPTSVKITGAATRWGSCSGKNALSFSWRLILASDEVINYVVVHELAHIRAHNHSPRFWAVVAQTMPDYQRRLTALKALQRRLMAEGWD